MKKKVVNMLSLLLATMMLLPACGKQEDDGTAQISKENQTEDSQDESEASAESEYPEYLNLDSAYPVIKDEYAGKVKPTLAICVSDSAREWDELWISKYLKQKYNLEFDVEFIRESALSERKSLILNSGQIPDIMLNFEFTTVELVNYGQEEGVFLAMDEYINETLTPNIMKYMADPVVEAACTAPDGHMYTLPYMSGSKEEGAYYNRYFVNAAALEEAGIAELPTTLDGFIDAMYALKEADADMYPFGGAMAGYRSNTKYLLQALGYVTSDAYGLEPCLRDGEVVIPAYDVEVYKEFLKILNQFYKDGIVVDNFFTIEDTEVNAMTKEGLSVVYATSPSILGIDLYTEGYDWASLIPLTSDWQDVPEVPTPNTVGAVGGFVISADTEYPELCMRFADLYFNNDTDCASLLFGGAGYDSEWSLDEEGNPDGYVHYKWLPDENDYQWGDNDIPEGYGEWDYLMEFMNGCQPKVGAYETQDGSRAKWRELSNGTYEKPAYEQYQIAYSDGRWNYGGAIEIACLQYAAETYPSFIYMSADDAEKVTDLRAVIDNYAKEQIAKFIVGERSLDEVDTFKSELQDLGMDELLEIYTKAYNK